MSEYRGCKIERVKGSRIGRRGQATKRFGFIVTYPDGEVENLYPNADTNVLIQQAHRIIDLTLEKKELLKRFNNV